jgi:hypothetical protein
MLSSSEPTQMQRRLTSMYYLVIITPIALNKALTQIASI